MTDQTAWCDVDNMPAAICNGPHVTHECLDGDLVTARVGSGPCPFCMRSEYRAETVRMLRVAGGAPDPSPWPRFGLFWPWTRKARK